MTCEHKKSCKCDFCTWEETECEHTDYEMIGRFPDNLEVVGEYMANKIKCNECSKIGTEYYSFVERTWE